MVLLQEVVCVYVFNLKCFICICACLCVSMPYIMCVCTCVYAYTCVDNKRRHQTAWNWSYRLLWAIWLGCWELNLCPMEEQQEFLTTETSLQYQIWLLLYLVLWPIFSPFLYKSMKIREFLYKYAANQSVSWNSIFSLLFCILKFTYYYLPCLPWIFIKNIQIQITLDRVMVWDTILT